MLISRTRYITLTMPLSIQEYKWLSANCRASRRNTAGLACGRRSIKGDAGMPVLNSCNKNQDKLWLNKPLLRSTDFTSCYARTINSDKELIFIFSLCSDYSDIESTSGTIYEEQYDYAEVTYEVITFCKLTKVWCIIYQCIQKGNTKLENNSDVLLSWISLELYLFVLLLLSLLLSYQYYCYHYYSLLTIHPK